ncbi:MAG: short-chain fatty acyl-CoA regulator family protein [Alphaproteobacteria bacterium]
MDNSIPGTRIRQRRRELGITQAALAKQVGISPSYLNLIEWNKRRIAGSLLRQIAGALELTLEDIDDVAERRLRESLLEAAEMPSLTALGVEIQRTSELIGRFPGWSRAIGALVRSEREASTRAEILSDRLSNDPFLGETVHKMLTRISSVRSASEILSDYSDITTDQRDRFNRMIQEESRGLTDVGEALALYLEKVEDVDRVLTPVDEVEALFDARENRFGEIEEVAAKLAEQLSGVRPSKRRKMAEDLASEHAVSVIDAIISTQPQIESELAVNRARRLLMQYAVGAILVPIDRFTEQAAGQGYDIERLADGFLTGAEVICHRLTALHRADGIPTFGYFRANAAGTIIERKSLEGLPVSRYAAACPLWILYRAQQQTETVLTQRALFPSGTRCVFIARARQYGPVGYGKPKHYLTDMLALSEEDAEMTVYARTRAAEIEEVGPGCRMCPREFCRHRVDDPLAG